ncbi:MAG: signal peptidase II [Omnitrophica WOR_2 bacterium GWF2_38_59]|nr:MAG: signal peptidase II [Omnitrophica WOR_2 bacterium GWF2_38_59]OGX47995.1 MAG: signal peptidase II [Omnitrophica WOR_2 bacterium RIFOXYA2_FULL_38_17]OGX51803.1 MAG: signal peptidase II [Omnitrophica WOR_2 bacterium RIFOXYA12_FULL_38_10]OGX56343.1 MAG: signal peptidase II [Omnitrophica WOR_2 bacterium RIFOXYC2_FULL_38_12]OGX60286.1 MAG: signal peptidase II [Omnitrophica WOR_2 bacterium RIFOXYB2_FULL_38_16]HBG61073.1 signal peptidase II [Candidatus Omnitrophota bacterium]
MKNISRSQVDIFISFVVVLSVILFDRLTKSFFSELLSFGESLPIIYNVLHMTMVHNTGIAFGFLKGHGAVPIIMTVIAFALLIFNIYYYRKNDEALTRSYIVAFSLIFGGAIGNLIDRITLGYVVDFIDFRFWPVFNIADSAITIGAIVILFKCFQVSTK